MKDEPYDWSPDPSPPPGRQFKWGLNGETGEFVVWEVGGPGDGFPSHADYLEPAWGRDVPSPLDTLGAAGIEPSRIWLLATRNEVPAEAAAWLAQELAANPPPFKDTAAAVTKTDR
jgi:hypothetical protein